MNTSPKITFIFDSEIEIDNLTFETILSSKITGCFINNDFLKKSQLKMLRENNWEILNPLKFKLDKTGINIGKLDINNLLSFKIITTKYLSFLKIYRLINFVIYKNGWLIFRIMLNNSEPIKNKLFLVEKIIEFVSLKKIIITTIRQTTKITAHKKTTIVKKTKKLKKKNKIKKKNKEESIEEYLGYKSKKINEKCIYRNHKLLQR